MASPKTTDTFLLFGGTGAIGGAILKTILEDGWCVVSTTRGTPPANSEPIKWLTLDPFAPGFDPEILDRNAPYAAVCWAQGSNFNDSIYDFNQARHEEIYRANVMFILVTLNLLLQRNLLRKSARLCLISSIWQNLARQNKISYSITKSALQGLVLSAATDIAREGHLINGVLPGVLDTPMTRKNLSAEQVERVSSATLFKSLPTLESVASLVAFLCSDRNIGITGQFIEADLGFSRVRII
jgi:NAD(P)-dependent dehydrogenase (short-subunit alcohol dehydrogenase family)